MGCCGSKEERDDDVHAPLLNDDDLPIERHTSYQAIETIDVKKEQEFWNAVLERTTRNLIDISSTNADPLQSHDVQERQDKYQDILAQLPNKTSDTTSIHNENGGAALTHDAKPLSASADDPLAIFDHIHPSSAPIPQEELYDMMNKISDALQDIRIEPVGEMVVHLKMLNDPEAIQF
ncbi:predicted protein [Lichtheimia corymbifera JMRC:FSU:9682]|uniref:Late endosomal/lysosomal adaptor and MAPK and MTOR activator 1 n=1 Tax=Lichtheimia corymbifera JMRC:FSU:9682 TaxID=1263082 RepID=A0A068RNJ2_9FUNG|nr:predicted protein [Lichtheimia corymbifera JMRC:FSU:9682]